MADPLSTRLGIPIPQASDLVSAGPAEMAAIITALEAMFGLEFDDILAPGVAGNASVPNASGPTVNTSTGVITVTLNADFAWVLVSGVLTRCALPTTGTALTPASLPTSGNFRCVGVFVAPASTWSATGALSTAVGTSQSSQTLALANPPSTPAGTILLEYVVLTNTSGTYSISTTVDMRTRALQVLAANLAAGAAAANVGALGGGLSGTLPNPTVIGAAPSGAAGGVLSGSFPNPGMASGAAATNVGALTGGVITGTLPALSIGAAQVLAAMIAAGAAASNVGTLGGDLQGTLPNPTLAPAIRGAWTTYSPSWNGSLGGGGALVGKYMLIGKTCHVRVSIVNPLPAAATVAQIGLPFNTANDGTYQTFAVLVDPAGTAWWGAIGLASPNTALAGLMYSGSIVEAGQPTGYSSGGVIVLQGVYETA